jgi:hypothetical protein
MSGELFSTSEPGRPNETTGVRLLVADPDLGRALEGEELEQARERAIFPSIELDEGPLMLDRLRDADGVRDHLQGFLVIGGSLTINLRCPGERAHG